jgi:hypothetical protein
VFDFSRQKVTSYIKTAMDDVINVKDGLGCKTVTLIAKRKKTSIFEAALRDDQLEEYYVLVSDDADYGKVA